MMDFVSLMVGDALIFWAGGPPSGIGVNATTGAISGTLGSPLGLNYATTTVSVSDGGLTTSQTFHWFVTGTDLVINNPGDQTNSEGDAVSLPIDAVFPGGAGAFAASGPPTGLSISSSGVISGTIAYSAAAILYDFSDTLKGKAISPNKTIVGLLVQDKWKSDSGDIRDLDQVSTAESTENVIQEGVFQDTKDITSSYEPATVFTVDFHGAATALMVASGGKEVFKEPAHPCPRGSRTGTTAFLLLHHAYTSACRQDTPAAPVRIILQKRWTANQHQPPIRLDPAAPLRLSTSAARAVGRPIPRPPPIPDRGPLMRPVFAMPALLLAASVLAAPARAGDLRNFEDAALHAVQFVDKSEGWAVGDDGVVWHTIDAGKAWERVPSGVRASLRSVCFVNPYIRLDRRPRGAARGRQLRRAALHTGRRRHLEARAGQRAARPQRRALRRRQDRLLDRRRLRPLSERHVHHHGRRPQLAARAGAARRVVAGGRLLRRRRRAGRGLEPPRDRPSGKTATAARPTPSKWTPSAVAICAASGCTARPASPSARAGWC